MELDKAQISSAAGKGAVHTVPSSAPVVLVG